MEKKKSKKLSHLRRLPVKSKIALLNSNENQENETNIDAVALGMVVEDEGEFEKEEFVLNQSLPAPRLSSVKCEDKASVITANEEVAPLSSLYSRDSIVSYIDQLFNVSQKLGGGSFGWVYEVKSVEDLKDYAIKVSTEKYANAKNEVFICEKVTGHTNIVSFIRAWKETHFYFIQMELCVTSLDSVILYNDGLRHIHYYDIMFDIASGLQHLHCMKLLHLDIKPANIMIDEKGVCKIGDFALTLDLNYLSHEKKPSYLESDGDGKYVAPEILENQTYTLAADIYCFGLSMVELVLSAVKPLKGHVWPGVRNEIFPDFYPNLGIVDELTALLTQMIKVDYTLRPTIEEILCSKVCEYASARLRNGQRLDKPAYVVHTVNAWRVDHKSDLKYCLPVWNDINPEDHCQRCARKLGNLLRAHNRKTI